MWHLVTFDFMSLLIFSCGTDTELLPYVYLNTPPWTLPSITGASFIHVRSRRKSLKGGWFRAEMFFDPWGIKKEHSPDVHLCIFF